MLRFNLKASYEFLQLSMLLPSLHHVQRVEATPYDPKENILDVNADFIQTRLDSFSWITQGLIDSIGRSIATMAASATITGTSTTKMVASMILMLQRSCISFPCVLELNLR